MTKTQCKCGWQVFNLSPTEKVIECPRCNTDIVCSAGPSVPVVLHAYRLGNCISIITHYTGIAWLVRRVSRGNCGCEKRKELLNQFSLPKLSIWRRA